MTGPEIPEIVPAAAGESKGAVAWLRANKTALAVGIGAFLALAFIGILLLPPLEEPPAEAAGTAPLFVPPESWKAPKLERGDPLALIRDADGLAGVGGGKPLEAPPVAGADDEADPTAALPETPSPETAGTPDTAGAAPGARKLAGKTLASLKEEKGLSQGRSRLAGGAASQTTAAFAAASPRAQEARGPVARARRRLSAAFQRMSRARNGLMAGLRRAFGGAGSAKPFDASTGSSPFAAAPGGAVGAASPGGDGSAIGAMGGDADSKSGGATTKLGAIKGTGPTRDISKGPAAKPAGCAVVKGALHDFCRAFDIVRNVNARYHSTGTEDKDLLVPLMHRSALKYDELDKQYAAAMGRFKGLRLDCGEACEKLDGCFQIVQLSIGTGDGSGIMREFQDAARAAQKGIGLCAARGYEDEGTAAQCWDTGLKAIEHDRKAKTLIEQHLVLVNAKREECKADETKGTPEQQKKAKDANAKWADYTQANLTAFKTIYDYLKPGWCDDARVPCVPIRLGKMREARKYLGNLEASGQQLGEFVGAGYLGKISETRSAMARAIKAHEGLRGEEGRNVFHGVHAEDQAASAINSLDLPWFEAVQKCGLSCPGGE